MLVFLFFLWILIPHCLLLFWKSLIRTKRTDISINWEKLISQCRKVNDLIGTIQNCDGIQNFASIFRQRYHWLSILNYVLLIMHLFFFYQKKKKKTGLLQNHIFFHSFWFIFKYWWMVAKYLSNFACFSVHFPDLPLATCT